MTQYTKNEIKLHLAGRKLQYGLPYYEGLRFRELENELKWGRKTLVEALDGLESKGKATSQKTKNGNRRHGTIRMVGTIPVPRTA